MIIKPSYKELLITKYGLFIFEWDYGPWPHPIGISLICLHTKTSSVYNSTHDASSCHWPVCPPTWLPCRCSAHGRRSWLGWCTRGAPSPRGCHTSTNRQAPLPITQVTWCQFLWKCFWCNAWVLREKILMTDIATLDQFFIVCWTSLLKIVKY